MDPKVPYAEALVFEDALKPLSVHGISVSYAMHPTCNGMKTLKALIIAVLYVNIWKSNGIQTQ